MVSLFFRSFSYCSVVDIFYPIDVNTQILYNGEPMNFITCKFGGTSVATSEKIERIDYILGANSNRRCAVLSAPGKAFDTDTKVTDLLISLCSDSLAENDTTETINAIKKRYLDIYQPLGVKETVINQHLIVLDKTVASSKEYPNEYRDAIVALGEDINAQLSTKYLH